MTTTVCPIPTHEPVCALAAQRYPDAPERRDTYLAACWEPVGTAYSQLLSARTTAHPDGQGCAA